MKSKQNVNEIPTYKIDFKRGTMERCVCYVAICVNERKEMGQWWGEGKLPGERLEMVTLVSLKVENWRQVSKETFHYIRFCTS